MGFTEDIFQSRLDDELACPICKQIKHVWKSPLEEVK